MKFRTRARHTWEHARTGAKTVLVLFLCAYLFTACDGSIVQALYPQSPEPQAGLKDHQGPLLKPIPGGLINTAGGNLFVLLKGLSVESALGTEEVPPAYNSATNEWSFGVISMTYLGMTFVDHTGAQHDVSSVADGEAIPGTVWIKVDSDTIKAKGGLIFEFVGGVLAEKHKYGQQCPRILYERDLATGELVIRQKDCGNRVEWSAFNTNLFTLALAPDGRVLEVVDRAGHVALYSYNADGRLDTARDGLDTERGWPGYRFEYDVLDGPLTAITNSEGNRIEYDYFSPATLGIPRLQFATQVNPAEGSGSFQYRFDYYADSTVVTDPMGDTERYSFDDDRRPLRIDYQAVAESHSWGYLYPGLRPSSHTRSDGTTESYTLTGDDILTITQPSGNVVEHTYAEANGPFPFSRSLAETRDTLGLLGAWDYTEDVPVNYRRLRAAYNGEGELTKYAYHPNGGYTRLASITWPDGVEWGFDEHHALGEATQIIIGGSVASVNYDDVGNRTGGSNGNEPEAGGVRTRLFDADRNPVQITVTGTDGLESLILLPRGSDGRVLYIDRPPLGLGIGPDHRFSYNALGQLEKREEMVDGIWQPTSFRYDARGRAEETLPNGMHREWVRDQRGRVTEHRIFRNGILEGEIAFTYLNGNLVRVADSERGTETRSYHPLTGMLTRVQYAHGETMVPEYDLRSRPTKKTYRYPDGTLAKVVEYGHDLANRETWIKDDGRLVVDRTFLNGRLDCVETGNHLRRCFTYDPMLGLRNSATTTNQDEEVVAATDLSARLMGIPVNWKIDATTSVFGLGDVQSGFTIGPGTDPNTPGTDVGKRVTRWSNEFSSRAFAYDGLSNQVDDLDGDRYDYNTEGNRLEEAQVAGELVSYVYDEAGFASSRNGLPIGWTAGGRMASYDAIEAEWDMQGKPLRVTDTGADSVTVRDWSWWGGEVVVDENDSASMDLGEVVLSFGGSRLYRHFDFRGNVSFVSNQAGQIVSLYEYTPYGVSRLIGNSGDGVSFIGKSMFGPFMLVGERMYDSLVGRFVSPDPVLSALNQFTYTLGNPVWFSDSDGREAISDGSLALAGLAIAVVGVATLFVPISFGLALGISLVGLGLAIIGVVVAFGGTPQTGVGETSTGCGCTKALTMGPGAEESQNPSGAAPSGNKDGGGGGSNLSGPGGGGGGFGGSFGGGGVPSACGHTGIEFLAIIWLALRRKRRSTS